MQISSNLAAVNFAEVSLAAVALVQKLIHPEYALRVVRRTSHRVIPDDYAAITTVQVYSIVYSLWRHRLDQGRMLVRLEGLGIFVAEFEDEQPAEAVAVVHSFQQAA